MAVDLAFIDRISVQVPAATFPFGAEMMLVNKHLRLLDRHRRLNLAGLLNATPYWWVWQDGYRIAKTMVTNGQYRDFLLDPDGIYNSKDIWNHVWHRQGLGIETYNHFVQGVDGQVDRATQQFVGVNNFVDAYVDSLESEVLQWADAGPENASRSNDPVSSDSAELTIDPRERLRIVRRVFAFVKSLLSDAIGGPGESGAGGSDHRPNHRDHEAALVHYGHPGGTNKFSKDVALIREVAVSHLKLRLPPQQRTRLARRPASVVEAVALLDRTLSALPQDVAPERVPLHKVLFPRDWPPDWSRHDSTRGFVFGAPSVPWEDRPVFGLTLYEAAAYCAWLSQKIGWKARIELPTEAQYERAASWPMKPDEVASDRRPLDPSLKLLFPWQESCSLGFNDLFGREDLSIERLYSEPSLYRMRLDQSARKLADDQQIEQLLGFGWHWCRERFDSGERRYSRFESNYSRQPFLVEDKLRKEALPVFRYTPNVARQHPNFVVRGAPEVLGGPGLTTRRFAMFPLRGYPNVGFRWICAPAEIGDRS